MGAIKNRLRGYGILSQSSPERKLIEELQNMGFLPENIEEILVYRKPSAYTKNIKKLEGVEKKILDLSGLPTPGDFVWGCDIPDIYHNPTSKRLHIFPGRYRSLESYLLDISFIASLSRKNEAKKLKI